MDDFTQHRIYALFTALLLAFLLYFQLRLMMNINLNQAQLQIILFSGVFLAIIFATPDDEDTWVLYSPAIFLAIFNGVVMSIAMFLNPRLLLSIL